MIAALQAKSETMAIVMIVIAFLTPLISALSAYFSKAALSSTKEIHTAVNGNNEAMRIKLEAYTQEILRLSTELSALREIQRIEASRTIAEINHVVTSDKRISELIREEIAKKS